VFSSSSCIGPSYYIFHINMAIVILSTRIIMQCCIHPIQSQPIPRPRPPSPRRCGSMNFYGRLECVTCGAPTTNAQRGEWSCPSCKSRVPNQIARCPECKFERPKSQARNWICLGCVGLVCRGSCPVASTGFGFYVAGAGARTSRTASRASFAATKSPATGIARSMYRVKFHLCVCVGGGGQPKLQKKDRYFAPMRIRNSQQ
jgi:hypothetical protein